MGKKLKAMFYDFRHLKTASQRIPTRTTTTTWRPSITVAPPRQGSIHCAPDANTANGLVILSNYEDRRIKSNYLLYDFRLRAKSRGVRNKEEEKSEVKGFFSTGMVVPVNISRALA